MMFTTTQSLTTVDLAQLAPGTVVELQTGSPATYWLTITSQMQVTDTSVKGVAITCGSFAARRFCANPSDNTVARVLSVGEPACFNNMWHTGELRSIRLRA